MDHLRSFVVEHGATVSELIEAKSIPSMGGGKGVVATAAIRAGSLIVSIPQALIVTTSVAREYIKSLQPPPETGDVASLSPVELIASFLVVAERNPQCRFYPWLRSLPRQYDNLLELPYPNIAAGAVSEALRSEAYEEAIRPFVWSARLRRKCVEERIRFEASAAQCLRSVHQLRELSAVHEVFESDGGIVTDVIHTQRLTDEGRCRNKFLWAYNSLMSRGFSYDEDIWAMMPWVDYFNYSLNPNATMRYNRHKKTYEFVTTRPIRSGEQLMLQYGKYSDFELALWYGFTLRPVLFPNGEAVRVTRDGTDNGSDSDDGSAVYQRNVHYAYPLSPTYDPNGDLPVGIAWAVELATRAGLAIPQSWLESQADAALQDVRLSWGGPNDGLQLLCNDLHSANGDATVEGVLKQLIVSELDTFSIPPQMNPNAAAPTTPAACTSFNAVSMAISMSEDHARLLQRFVDMTPEQRTKLMHNPV